MCGITGAVPAIDSALLRAMTSRLAHRGPDGEDYFHSPHAALGHRRLAIIDLPGGRQPMTSADGRYTIVFNGEIYNFRGLRAELESTGVCFRTRSDTEVLVEGFARWGREALQKLRGMFAFAVWDAHERVLFAARDRLGVKPFYYAVTRDHLLFASEIKALLAHPEVDRSLHFPAVDDFLTYLYVPAPQTIFRGVRELPPAHWLEWKNHSLRIQRYWDARPLPVGESNGDHEIGACTQELLEILGESVRLRLVSDVPLGAFLSGGLDSSSILALAAQATRERLKTFSLGFGAGEERYTEIAYARQVAARYSTEHRELEIRSDCADELSRMVAQFDEPFGNPTALLVGRLSELTRRHVTVALAGDAGDEVFLGYPRYLGIRLRSAYDRIPLALRRAFSRASNWLSDDLRGRHNWRRLREFLSTGSTDWRAAYANWVCYFTPGERVDLYTEEFRRQLGGHDSAALLNDCFGKVADCTPLDQVSYADLHTFLPFNLLEYGDRMSMAHGLEVRLPFTDHKLVEFALRLPAQFKLRGSESKHILRRAVRGLLPAEILERPKLGLNPPLGIWLQNDLAPRVEEMLGEAAVRRRGWFHPAAVRRIVESYRSGRRDYSLQIWALLVLEEWCRQHLDRAPVFQREEELAAVTGASA